MWPAAIAMMVAGHASHLQLGSAEQSTIARRSGRAFDERRGNQIWMGSREVYGSGLENRSGSHHRGFESYAVRTILPE
jgi:hypothetical protein